mgnify:CR=1 FL=1
MDRFKFRVWNIENKNFIYDAIYAYDGNNYSSKDNDGWIFCFGEYIDRNNEYIAEQCTGLKDKNGKLIYEGDIIRYTYDWREEIKPVEFDTISACYGVKICKDFIVPFANNLSKIEVIGNIHENKDLLKNKLKT